ncbi:MAG: tetratricopeptide repeat protein [Armatimonadetes bacterium]|nr:tetratricopeptide repeat protein [Armatimonadota bacterium]
MGTTSTAEVGVAGRPAGSGTLAVLAVDGWQTTQPGVWKMACSAVFDAGTVRLAAFALASDALAAAGGLLEAASASSQQAALRILVHVGEVPDDWTAPRPDGGLPEVAAEALRQLAGAPPGCVACTPEAAAVLRRVAQGAVLCPLDSCAADQALYRAAWPRAELGRERAERAADATAFVGRAEELKALLAWLTDPDVRLVTVTGVAGCGKTRLAEEAAGALAPDWPGLVATVPLAGLDAPELVVSAVLQGLDVAPAEATSALTRLTDALAGQPTLLVLDNLEHLGAAGAEQVEQLLAAIPTLTCLGTSRVCLAVPGERVLELGPLAVPGHGTGDGDLAAVDSVKLYLDRVSRVDPSFRLTDELRPVVAQLCTRLEGLPLAIELAAGCGRSLPPAVLLARWDERLDLLACPTSTAGRHRSLRAALAWSHDLLPPRSQRLFARLSVFRGSWSLEAAETVCGEPDALRLVEGLRDASLVECVEVGPTMRFRLLETLREYGRQKLEERGEAAALQTAHLAFYRRLAAEGAACLERDGESRACLERFDAEQEEFRAALSRAFESGAETGLALAGSLWRYWLVRGRWQEGLVWLERGLGDADLAAACRGRALGWLGHLHFRLGSYDRAGAALAEALAIHEADGDRTGIANDLNELGKVHWAQGDLEQAQRCYERSLAARRALNHAWGVAAALGNLGAVAAATGDTARAMSYLEEGLASRRQLGDRRGTAASLNNLGALALADCRYGAAERYLTESLTIRVELNDRPGAATALNDLGALYHALGRLLEAHDHCTRSLALRRELGDRRGVAVTLCNLGLIAADRGDLPGALAPCEESVALHREIGDKRGLARALTGLGDVLLAADDGDRAWRCHNEALALHRGVGDEPGAALALSNLGEVAAALGRYEEAEECLADAAEWAQALASPWLQTVVQRARGQLRLAEGRDDEGLACLLDSLAGRCRLGERRGLAALLVEVASASATAGDARRAARWLGAAEVERERNAGAGSGRALAGCDRLAARLATDLGAAEFAAQRAAGRASGAAALLALQQP